MAQDWNQAMQILFIGGTGLISTACAAAAVSAGHELWTLNRGRSALPNFAAPDHMLTADATREAEVAAAVKDIPWDVVVQWVGYTPRLVEQDIRVFQDVGQYVFISSASVYSKPPPHWIITEKTPKANPYWSYAREKIDCELVLQNAHSEAGFPMTIVRPSLTYGPSQIPVIIGSWDKPYTIVDRMRRGAKIIVPGDGTSIWTLTHNTDFAKGLIGLLGQPAALGEDFHITSDEALSWNQIYSLVGAAAGAEPDIIHVPSAGIIAADPAEEGSLWGDKAYSTVFDNSKLRQLVPGYLPTKTFAQGIQETVAWFDADASRQDIDQAANARWDRLAGVYEEAMAKAAG
jgi:nucleoside-diphosphate-sugar epimerase